VGDHDLRIVYRRACFCLANLAVGEAWEDGAVDCVISGVSRRGTSNGGERLAGFLGHKHFFVCAGLQIRVKLTPGKWQGDQREAISNLVNEIRSKECIINVR
jgi:hypothetical protein